MQVGQAVAFRFDRLAHPVRHAPVRHHVEQDGARVPDQAKGPARDHAGADDACQGIHP